MALVPTTGGQTPVEGHEDRRGGFTPSDPTPPEPGYLTEGERVNREAYDFVMNNIFFEKDWDVRNQDNKHLHRFYLSAPPKGAEPVVSVCESWKT